MSLFAQKSSVYGWGYGGLLLLLALFLYRSANDASIEHVSSGEYICTKPDYTIRILSYEPLMMHIENFFTSEEREHLLELSAPHFNRSTISSGRVDERRTSSTATLSRNDSVVSCIHQRVSEFQGYVPKSHIENLQVTRYTANQQFKAHFDWRHPPYSEPRTVDRITTFFGILDADCESCGTQFPRVTVDWDQEDERWCRIVDCKDKEMLTVNPLVGSALFWRNLNSGGVGDPKTLHAGLPVGRGHKVGLNIWTEVAV